jgi:hypothetical protein
VLFLCAVAGKIANLIMTSTGKVEAWVMWIDLQYSFGAAFSEKEREIIDALELPRRFGGVNWPGGRLNSLREQCVLVMG